MSITHSSVIQNLLFHVAHHPLHHTNNESIEIAINPAPASSSIAQARRMACHTGHVLNEAINRLCRAHPRAATVCLKCFTYHPWPVVAVGSIPELGDWDPNRALGMQLEAEMDGLREWRASFRCPADQPFEFKFVAAADWGPLWQSGENRMCRPDAPWIEISGAFEPEVIREADRHMGSSAKEGS